MSSIVIPFIGGLAMFIYGMNIMRMLTARCRLQNEEDSWSADAE